MSYFDNTNTGELMARVKDDIDKIWNALGYVGMLVIEVIIHVSFVLYCMFRLNWKLAFLPLTTMIICGTVAIVMERKLDKIYEEISEENAVLTTVAEENLAGVRTVKAFAREKYEIEKFKSHNKRYYDLNVSQAKTLVRYYPIFQFVGKALPVATTILGGVSVMNGTMSLGALVALWNTAETVPGLMEVRDGSPMMCHPQSHRIKRSKRSMHRQQRSKMKISRLHWSVWRARLSLVMCPLQSREKRS